jgi:hypothetical protein
VPRELSRNLENVPGKRAVCRVVVAVLTERVAALDLDACRGLLQKVRPPEVNQGNPQGMSKRL